MDTPQSKFETTWWEHVGWTDWKDTPGGGQMRESKYRRLGADEERLGSELPCGALFSTDRENAESVDSFPPAGSDGLSIVCVLRYNDWKRHFYVDYNASNCTKKDERTHRCWVRHGTVGDQLTLDKNGNTCGAGAGSLFMGPNHEWHGFLRDGVLAP